MNLQDLENLVKELRAAIAPGGEPIELTEEDFAGVFQYSNGSKPSRKLRDRRCCFLGIRLTSEEEKRLQKLSEGISRATYVRAKIFGYPLPRPRLIIPQVNRDTYVELAKIGGNLNQQTKAINRAIAHGINIDKNALFEYRQQLEMLSALLQQVRSELVSIPAGSGELDEDDLQDDL